MSATVAVVATFDESFACTTSVVLGGSFGSRGSLFVFCTAGLAPAAACLELGSFILSLLG